LTPSLDTSRRQHQPIECFGARLAQAQATRWSLEAIGQNVFALAARFLPNPYLGAKPDTWQVQMQPDTIDHQAVGQLKRQPDPKARQAVWSWWYRDPSDVEEGPLLLQLPLGARLTWCEPKGGKDYRFLNANLQNDTLSLTSQASVTPGVWYFDML